MSSRQLTAEDREDLEAINATITHMQTLTPSDPYILTIPQDVEPRYHHSYAFQTRQWLENTPFDPREHESTQYQTFVFHEPGKDMFMLHPSRVEKKTAREKEAGAGTPKLETGKKKISLDAYKKKNTGGTPTEEQQQTRKAVAAKAPVKGPVERVKADEEVLAGVDSGDESGEEKGKDLKRKREDGEAKAGGEQGGPGNGENERAAKKAKITPTSSQTESTVKNTTSHDDPTQSKHRPKLASKPAAAEDEQTKLPPKLSPPPSAPEESTLPPKLSPISMPSLPTALSPTMPENINATLKARNDYRSHSRSSDTDDRNLMPSLQKPEKKSPRNGFRANSSSPATRSDAEERVRSRNAETAVESDSAEESIPVAKSKKPANPAPAAKSLVVKLKFKKAQREAVRRILKMRPNPVKSEQQKSSPSDGKTAHGNGIPSTTANRARRDTNAKGVAQKVGPGGANGVTKRDSKRPLSDEDASDASDERPAKRKKNMPSTPEKASLISPTSTHKSTLIPSTMRKDLLSAAPHMKPDLSADSNNTPSQQISPPTSSQPQATTKPGPSTKTSDQQAWESEQRRLERQGRELKHAATAHLQASEPTLAALKSLESLLSYILAFTCADRAALAAQPKQQPSLKTWRSMHGFYGFVKRNCEAVPELLGVVCSLGVVFNSRILELNSKEGVLAHDSVLETQAMMLRAAHDAEARLDVDALLTHFPRTWAGRTKDVAGKQDDIIPGKGFRGVYKLPLGLQTSPLRAARAGMAMLEEWVEGKGVEYSMQLKL